MVRVPVSDQCEHFYMILYFPFGPCTSPRSVPGQCEYTTSVFQANDNTVVFIRRSRLFRRCPSSCRLAGRTSCRTTESYAATSASSRRCATGTAARRSCSSARTVRLKVSNLNDIHTKRHWKQCHLKIDLVFLWILILKQRNFRLVHRVWGIRVRLFFLGYFTK